MRLDSLLSNDPNFSVFSILKETKKNLDRPNFLLCVGGNPTSINLSQDNKPMLESLFKDVLTFNVQQYFE